MNRTITITEKTFNTSGLTDAEKAELADAISAYLCGKNIDCGANVYKVLMLIVNDTKARKEQTKQVQAKVIDSWYKWREEQTGVVPKIDGKNAKAAQSLAAYFISITKPGHEPETAMQFILSNWHKLDAFLQSRCDLAHINSSINQIIEQIKNGTGNRKGIKRQSVSDLELADAILKRNAGVNKSTNQ